MDRRRAVDLLPDRAAGTMEGWLLTHSGIEVMARDRGSAYGPAASHACPGARQVADCWHLFENACAAYLDAVHSSMPRIRAAVSATAANPRQLTAAVRRRRDGCLRRAVGNTVIRRLAEAEMPIKRIVRRTGRCRKLVRAVVRSGGTDSFRPG